MADPFSAHNRRQTLAEIKNVQQSAIPQPGSVFRKSTHKGMAARASSGAGLGGPPPRVSLAPARMFQRSSSGINLVEDLEMLGLQGRESFRKLRQSYGPSRRSSGYSARASNVGLLSQKLAPVPQKDPRQVRDKAVQSEHQHRILEYLLANGYPHPVSLKTLQAPTNKDFALIFRFLYNRLDPNYQFVKKIEDEVIVGLKTLKYPFADHISKSQISAVGSMHAWPSMLAMLDWLVELDACIDSLSNDAGISLNDESNLSERLFFNYLAKSYSLFLTGHDDFSEAEKDLQSEFDQRNETMLTEIERLERECDTLVEELEKMNEDASPLLVLEKKKEVLESDKEKFKQYIQHLEAKRQKLQDLNVRIKLELVEKERELEKLHEERTKWQHQVDNQSISAADVDRMTSEKENLIKGLENVAAKMNKVNSSSFEKETIAQKKAESLEKLVQEYNSLAYKISVIPPTATYANDKHFELELNVSLNEPEQGCTGQLINRDLRHDIKPALQKIRQELSGTVHEEQDDAIQLQELLDKVCEGLSDKRDELEALEARLTAVIEQFNEIKDTMSAETAATNAESERLERELHQMQISSQNGFLHIEQRTQSVGIEYDQLVHASNDLKQHLYHEVLRMLEDVIKFKLHVQTELENMETRLEEVQKEAVEETGMFP